MNNKTWDINKKKFITTPKEIIDFFKEIDEVCKKYNLSISHEDKEGSFKIEEYKENNILALKASKKQY